MPTLSLLLFLPKMELGSNLGSRLACQKGPTAAGWPQGPDPAKASGRCQILIPVEAQRRVDRTTGDAELFSGASARMALDFHLALGRRMLKGHYKPQIFISRKKKGEVRDVIGKKRPHSSQGGEGCLAKKKDRKSMFAEIGTHGQQEIAK